MNTWVLSTLKQKHQTYSNTFTAADAKMETSGDDDAFQDVPRNLPIPHANLPSSPLPPSSLPAGGTSPSRPPNLQTVIARLSPTKPVLSSHSKTKDGLIRMLLQSSPLQQAQLASGSSNTEQESQADTTQGPGYIARLCGTERALSLIQLDHCYSKPWNWKPESSLCQPTKTLFVPRVSRNSTGIETPDHGDDLPDVVAEPLAPGPPYDPQQAYKVMNECDRFVSFANPRLCGAGDEEDLSGWEEAIPRDGWSAAQAKLFSKMMKVLTQDRLARLALEGQPNEPVLRRIAVDRAAKRARAVLAAPPCVWDRSLVQWLQGLLTARLPRPYLAAWLDILQTLRSHLPGLVDRLLAAPTGGFQLDSRARAVSREGLNLLLRRPWDPAATGMLISEPNFVTFFVKVTPLFVRSHQTSSGPTAWKPRAGGRPARPRRPQACVQEDEALEQPAGLPWQGGVDMLSYDSIL